MDANLDLRLGRWQDVMPGAEVDALITDLPYGARTHAGHNEAFKKAREMRDGSERAPVAYQHLTPEDVAAFVSAWSPRTRGWMACMTSHDLIPAWEQAYADAGRYHFAPVPCVIRGMTFRMLGDGPSSWTVYLMVARPRTVAAASWGTLPGAYVVPKNWEGSGGGRGKPLDLMRAIVSDYSRPGDLVCDPCAGYGSTLAAALQKGRRGIGAEMEEPVYHEARKRLEGVAFVDLVAHDAGRKPKQSRLL